MGPKKQSKKITKLTVDSDTEDVDEEVEELDDIVAEDDVNEEDDAENEENDIVETIEHLDDDDENEEVDEDEDNDEKDGNISDTEMKADIVEELDNCYFQYDNMIDEFETLGTPTRVPDEDRITLNRLTKYEIVRILGIRTKQISVGAKTLVKNINAKSPIEIAIFELINKMSPFKIKRPLPNNTYEIWKIKDLNIVLSDSEMKSIINSFN